MKDELEYLNSLTAPRRERLCRRDSLRHLAVQAAGWLMTVVLAVLLCAARAH